MGFPLISKGSSPTVQTRLVSVAEQSCIQMRCMELLGRVIWGRGSNGADAGTEKDTWEAQVLILMLLGPRSACICEEAQSAVFWLCLSPGLGKKACSLNLTTTFPSAF